MVWFRRNRKSSGIEIDFNSRDESGCYPILREQVPLAVPGDFLRVCDDEGERHTVRVTRVDRDAGLVYVLMEVDPAACFDEWFAENFGPRRGKIVTFLKWLGQATLVFAIAGFAGLLLMTLFVGAEALGGAAAALALILVLGYFVRDNR